MTTKPTVTVIPQFKTQWDNIPAIGCPVIGVSLTVPDESYSIRDILTKFTRMPDIEHDMVFDFDENTDEMSVDMDVDVITSFNDLTDFDMMSDRVKYLTDQVNGQKAELEQKRLEKAKSEAAEASSKSDAVV